MIDGIRRRLTRLEALKPNPMDIGDVRNATDEQLEAYIIACDIGRRKAEGLPAIEYERPLSDSDLAAVA